MKLWINYFILCGMLIAASYMKYTKETKSEQNRKRQLTCKANGKNNGVTIIDCDAPRD